MTNEDVDNDVLDEQLAYYRARAPEYDDWFYRRGRHRLDDDKQRTWFDEVGILERELARLAPCREILELAGGTGIWTKQLAAMGEKVTVLDASPEMTELNRKKVAQPNIVYRETDLFTWWPDQSYDLVFAGFWLSHVPPENLATFLAAVHEAVSPGGHFFFFDGIYNPVTAAGYRSLGEPKDIYRTRKLNDGRCFRIVKVFYEPADLRAELRQAGFETQVNTTGEFFWYAVGTRSSQ